MAQRKVWHVDEIAPVVDTLLALAPTADFAAGVMAVAQALGVPVQPHREKLLVIVELAR